jgi:hypothetical protein
MMHAKAGRAVLVAVCSTLGASAQLFSADGSLSLIGSALLTDIVDVHYHGTRALGATKGGIVLVDFANPGEPELLGYLPTNDITSDVILTDSIAYAACGSQGVLIVTVTDSLAGSPASTIVTRGRAEGFCFAHPHLYVASGYGLEIFNVLDPYSPRPDSALPLAGAPNEVWISDTLAFVSDSQKKLWIASVADPSAPHLLGSEVTWANPMDVVSTDGVAILAEFYGIVSYDVSDPGNIVAIDTVDTPGRALDFSLESPRLYLADDKNGTHLFAVQESGVLEYQNTLLPLVPAEDHRGVSARSDTVVIGEDMTAIFMVDWQDSPPILLGRYDVPGYVSGACMIGNGMVAIAEGSRGIRILRMRGDGKSDLVSLLDLAGTALDVEVKDTLAFVPAGQSGLHVVNISDPFSPDSVATVGTLGADRDMLEVRAWGQYLYVVDSEFDVIEVSDPRNPVVKAELETPDGYSNDLFVQSPERIYIANGSEGLLVVNAENPQNPMVIGQWNGGSIDTRYYAQGVWVRNGLAYLAADDSLVILDVEDPSDIRRLGAASLGAGALDVVVAGTFAFVGLEDGAVTSVDVSDPAIPVVADRYETSDMTLNLSLSGDTLVVADRSSLLLLAAEGVGIEGSEPAHDVPRAGLLQNFPNPFNPSTTITIERGTGGNTEGILSIYDIRGRLRRALPVPAGRGRVTLTWDGRDEEGRELPSGIYLYSLGEERGTRKMLLLR